MSPSLVLFVVAGLSGVRLQGGVVSDGVLSTRAGTRAPRYDWVIGGELGAAPLFDGADYVRLQSCVIAGTLGAAGQDGNAAVRVSSVDVRWATQVFAYYPFGFTSWLALRPGAFVGLDLAIVPTTIQVLGAKTSHTAVLPGVDVGARVEVDLWHFYVAFQAYAATVVSAGVARTALFFGGVVGAHFDITPDATVP